MIANWLKWYWLHIRLFFRNKKKIADNEIKAKTVNSESIRNHNPTDNEESIAREYTILLNDFGSIKRMNSYFWLFLILYAVGFGLWHAIGAPDTYTENRGVDCPPDSGFWSCLEIYVNQYKNFPLLLLMGLIVTLLAILGSYEWMRGRGERITDEEHKEGKNWLKLVAEDSRKLTPWYWWIVLLLGLLIEAAAFSIIASSYISDLSTNIELLVGSTIGIVVAAALGMFVHNAGVTMYRNQKRQKLEFAIECNKNMSEYTALQTDFTTEEPSVLGRFLQVVFPVAIIVIISVLAYQQRYQLNMNIIEQQFETVTKADFFEDDLPQDIKNQQEKVQDEFAENSKEREKKGLTSALVLLATIFVLINLLGGMLGYKHSLFNDKSEKSYKDVSIYKRWKKAESQKEEEKRKVQAIADKYFSKYHEFLIKAANKRKDHDEKYDLIAQALEERGAFNLKNYKFSSDRKAT